MKKYDEVLTWGGLHGTRDATVRVRVFDDMVFINRLVVIMTEPVDNKGTSVTNGVEQLAPIICEKFGLNPVNCTFVEHYPTSDRPETFDVVTFKSSKREYYGARRGEVWTFRGPEWSRLEWPPLRNSIVDAAQYPGSAPLNFDEL